MLPDGVGVVAGLDPDVDVDAAFCNVKVVGLEEEEDDDGDDVEVVAGFTLSPRGRASTPVDRFCNRIDMENLKEAAG